MSITQDGNSFTWDGTVTVTNATDLTTGVATLVLTPSGGVGQLPVLAQGAPGLPPVIDSVVTTTLAAGSQATGSLTTVSSGGAGIASHYILNIGIPAGASGYSLNATQTITLVGSPTGGTFTLTYNGQTTSAIAYNATNTTVQTAITALSTVGTGNAVVAGAAGGPWVVAFASTLGAIATMTGTSSLTGGSTPGVSVQGNYTLRGSADLDTTTISLQNDYTIKWVTSTGKFRYAAQLCGDTIQMTGISSYTGNSSLQALGSISVPAQKFNWIPNCKGLCYPTGTANTHVDMVAVIAGSWPSGPGNTLATGWQVAYGGGVTGAGSGSIPAYPVTLQQAFGGTLGSGYGVIPAGYSATLFFAAKQTATTTDAYTAPATGAYFSVHIDPVPGTN